MRKIFTLFAAMLMALTAVNAKVKHITPTSPEEHSNLQLALYWARHGQYVDTIMLGGGVYDEKNNYLDMDTNIVIMASETASSVPVIKMKTAARISNAAKIQIKGLKFDGSVQGSYDYYFCFYDNSHTSLILDDCEFYGVKTDVIAVTSSSNHTDSLIVNNCYFHNNNRGAIYFKASSTSGRQSCDKLVVKNSTFANFTTMDGHHLIEINNYGATETSDIRTVVDHCTFYNYGKRGLQFEALYSYKSTNVSVTNSIFSNDTIPGQRATWLYGGSVSNCLVNNVINKNYSPQATVTNGITGDPLFVNAASGNFALKGDWKIGEISPARGAGTDGSDLGDPRWYTAEVLPNVDFDDPYILAPAASHTLRRPSSFPRRDIIVIERVTHISHDTFAIYCEGRC